MLEQGVATLKADIREVNAILGRIEQKLDRFDERLRRVEVELAEAKGRVAWTPTTWTLGITGFGMVLSTCGLMFAIALRPAALSLARP